MMNQQTLARCARPLSLLASALIISACVNLPAEAAPEAAHVQIIPAPKEAIAGEGAFVLSSKTSILHTRAGSENVAKYFVDLAQRTRALTFAAPAPEPASGIMQLNSITFVMTRKDSATSDESYSLVVTPMGVTVSSAGERGLFYGAVTLWQLMTASEPGSDGTTRIASVTIHDAPRFAWRGLMLDSCRHFQSPRFIKLFIDWMALHKLNTFHWHLTDDQAWRLEIKKYPKLTSVGAWRVPAGPAAAADIDVKTHEPRKIGGFYTQDEVREIVKYAAERHITVVPEIEMPGHASAAVVAYPELGVSRHLPMAVPEEWGVFTTLFNADETTFTFLEDVLKETMQLFPSEYIHVGGDEAVKDEWIASPAIQARMKQLGVKNEHELQGYFIQRMGKFLSANGRKLIGWDEILEGGVPPDATVMSWRGIDGAITAANAGHDTVLSPAPQLYLDHWQFDGDPAPGRSNTLTLEDVYKFDPVPASIPVEQRKHVLGVQANLWAEFMRSSERVEYMAFPRAAALAEVAWSDASHIDWADFQTRLPTQLKRYDELGIRYAKPLPVKAPDAHRRNSHQLEACGDGYLLSLEDDAPIVGPRAVFLVNITNPCWMFKGAELDKVESIRATVGQIPFNFQIGKDASSIPLTKPRGIAGEFEVRIDNCDGPLLTSMSLEYAQQSYALTTLPPAKIAAQKGKHDLCLRFTRAAIDPIWTIDSVELVGN